ncbi:MAG: histidine phosphatase family protein [Phycisphaeraceae bacterium]|nr:histidine phosphatase family protein [Phycisphaeraceae bacterium]
MARTDDLRVLLVRSGPTDWDDAGRLQGETDLPLSACGREAFAARVASVAINDADSQIDVVLHGPDECSGQSGRILAAQLGVRARQVEDFREMDMGLWEGMRESELLERHPTVYKQWRADPTAVTPPDGDTLADAEVRVLRALRKSLEKAGRAGVAIVLRPVSLGIVRCWLTQRPLEDLWEVVGEAPEGEWFTVPRDRLKDLAVELKTGA